MHVTADCKQGRTLPPGKGLLQSRSKHYLVHFFYYHISLPAKISNCYTTEQLSPVMDYHICNGRTYMYFNGEPLFPFGHGLSYASCSFSNFKTNIVITK